VTWLALLGAWEVIGPFPTYDEAANWLVSGDWASSWEDIWDGSEPTLSADSYPRVVILTDPGDLIGLTLGDEPGEFTVEGALDIARDLLEGEDPCSPS
jgi:hypothetical protein